MAVRAENKMHVGFLYLFFYIKDPGSGSSGLIIHE
jgi:hypothetical protein